MARSGDRPQRETERLETGDLDRYDVLAGVGFLLMEIGLGLVHPGLAVALIGLITFGVALWGSRG